MSFNPDRINIKDLTIEEPEKGVDLPFDPERDITEKDWEAMEKLLVERFNKSVDLEPIEVKFLSELAMNMKILNAEKRMDGEVVNRVKEALQQSVELEHSSDTVLLAMELSIVDPEYKISLSQKDIDIQRKFMEKDRGSNMYDFSFDAIKVKMLCLDIPITEEDLGRMSENLEAMKEAQYWMNFTHLAANLRVLNPKVNLPVDKDAWLGMQQRLDEARGKSYWSTFAEQAASMKIIAAEDVYVPEKGGLVVNMKKAEEFSQSEAPQLPEQRNF